LIIVCVCVFITDKPRDVCSNVAWFLHDSVAALSIS